MAELSIPVATIVGAEMVKHTICETIKSLRDSYMEFCEEDEFIETIVPIEQDPEPYANGTKKTRPILKKYAQALLDKLQLDQLEAEAQRDIHLTPQQVKADVKRYVSICEKKIAKQQEQLEQLSEVVKVLITYQNKPYQNLLTHCALTDPKSLDYFMPHFKIEEEHTSTLHYAIYGKCKIESVQKLLDAGANVNYKVVLVIDGKHPYESNGSYSPLEVASLVGSLEIVKLLIEKGATIRCDKYGDIDYKVPNGPEGDLVAGYLQTHGSKPVTRF